MRADLEIPSYENGGERAKRVYTAVGIAGIALSALLLLWLSAVLGGVL